jgi:hypothetical protein
MATRKTTPATRKATKKAAPRKAAARKAPAKKATKKAVTKKAVTKKTASKTARRPVVRKAASKTTTARKAVAKKARKTPARKAATGMAAKPLKKSTKVVKKTAVKAAKQAPPRSAANKTVGGSMTARPERAGARSAAENPQRRRAARSDATTTVQPSTATTTNFSTTRAATPRDSDRGTSRTRQPHRITPEEALANTRELLEAKQAHDREPPAWRKFDAEHGQPAREAAMPARDAEQEADANAHARELHEAESRLKAIQGSVSQQDRHHQGRKDAKD